jgi:peroxiredoxin Q/BCP
MKKPQEKDKAPDFTLLGDDGNEYSLASFKGKDILVYFYPKDDTPGCTTEACEIRDNYKEMEKLGLVVLGISPDNIKSHGKFKEKYNLPFRLLSDTDHKVCELYGAWAKKKFMGREYMGVLRSSFLIDKKGVIKKIYHEVKPKEHAKEVIEDVK